MAWAYFKHRGNTRERTGFRKDSRKHQQEDKILGKRGGNTRERTRYWVKEAVTPERGQSIGKERG